MDSINARYRFWSTHHYFDEETRAELRALEGRTPEVQERFHRDLEFGTAGLRGIIGAGTNRMNRYTVRQATQGLADYISSLGDAARRKGVVIAHDPRRFSPEFAKEAALVLAAAGIKAYLWESLRPTPMLSFAVRRLGTTAGIVVTASHNPPEYNGYKVYGEDGGQIPPEPAEEILARIRAVSDLTAVHPMAEEAARSAGLLEPVPAWVDRAYLDHVKALAAGPDLNRSACKILYTPLHGTGNLPVRRVLTEAGYDLSVVPEQADPDPEFSTVRYPNPEEPGVYELALRYAELKRPDVILATDPDADRLGVMTRTPSGEYVLLTGNQLGVLLTDFIIRRRRELGNLPETGVVIKSLASTNMVAPLCREYGVQLMDVHTGFKFIGDKIREFEETGSHTFLFGFEESYGYLAATFVRDKDAVMTALLLAEAVAWHRAQGRTLHGALEELWQKYGYFAEQVKSVTISGIDGPERMAALMADLRSDPPATFGPVQVAFADDYQAGTSLEVATGRVEPLELGKANVLHYRMADGGFVMVRPSGTEPKLKIYFSLRGESPEQGWELLDRVRQAVLDRMGL